jgi:NitT/TauT family transport system permease protein
MTEAAPFASRQGAAAAGGAARPVRALPRPSDGLVRAAKRLGWTLVSVGLFALIWEICWALGWADPKLLPPPHIFLGDFADQARFFNTATRWQIGQDPSAGPSPLEAVLITVGATSMRVVVGLLIASVLAIVLGVLIRYYWLVEKLTLPTVMLLSPVSPIAWLPVAIFLFGIGNAPAIFMVVIALFFHMTLATITHIDNVNPNFIAVARTMGASKRQLYVRVIIPAILPNLLMVLRLNLFAAWMVVLIAESTGVGYGMGQVIMLARNTFNPSLVFFSIALIGALGFLSDWMLRMAQKRLLYWVSEPAGGMR